MQVNGYLIVNYMGKILLVNDALPYTKFSNVPLVKNGFKPDKLNFTFDDVKFVTYHDVNNLNMIYYQRATRKPKIVDDNILWINMMDLQTGVYNLTLFDKEILNVCLRFLRTI